MLVNMRSAPVILLSSHVLLVNMRSDSLVSFSVLLAALPTSSADTLCTSQPQPQAPLQVLSHCLDVDREASSAVSRRDMCETEKVKRFRRLSARSLRFHHCRSAKLDEPGLLEMERQ